ncbi:MAG: FecR domain-containing protein [Pyrinomonadaceae bacterium]|nr:FecR domain-containing protein [Pyrinomonadaceae bacterium]
MRSTRRSLHPTILSLLLMLFATAYSVHAEDDYADEYDEKARVVRISLIEGEVSLKRNGNGDWERARLNFPLVEGDTVSTDRESRLEIQIDARNFVRLESNSILRIVTLRDEGVALSVVEGAASVRLAKFDSDREYFEIDAPKTTMAAEKKGLYRIDVARDGRVRLTARDGGRARIYSETSGFTLRDGRTAELIFQGVDAGDWELLAAGPRDSWDSWIDDRERYLAQRMRYDNKYYDNYVWGAEDLDAYGTWAHVNDYGWIWRPHLTVINHYPDWAPYRHGDWTWCPPYGWTWVGYEPWGWAPYHYGRWVYHNNYWAWCPRSQYYRHRSWWRPALVAFHINFGNHISWYPLSYHHRDPRSRHYRDRDRLTPMRERELANLRRVNPAHLRAITIARAADFGGAGGRFQTADQALARRVISAEPVRGDLPLRPARVTGGGPGGAASEDHSGRMITARPARVAPSVGITDRPTGAAARTPGVSLDNDLRRTRILNGREPRTVVSADNATPDHSEARPTGAVVRPARPGRIPVDRPDQPPDGREATDNTADRPARPARTYPQRERPLNSDTPDINDSSRERRPPTAPIRPPASEIEPPADRPRPERTDRRERNELPARPERNRQPVDMDRPERSGRPERRERTETPAPRPDPPARSYEPPPSHSAPEPHEERPQRYEPAPRNDPPPRSDPPPQRAEPEQQRSEPTPQRSDPEPQRSEPAPQRSEPAQRPDPPARSEPSAPARVRPPISRSRHEL